MWCVCVRESDGERGGVKQRTEPIKRGTPPLPPPLPLYTTAKGPHKEAHHVHLNQLQPESFLSIPLYLVLCILTWSSTNERRRRPTEWRVGGASTVSAVPAVWRTLCVACFTASCSDSLPQHTLLRRMNTLSVARPQVGAPFMAPCETRRRASPDVRRFQKAENGRCNFSRGLPLCPSLSFVGFFAFFNWFFSFRSRTQTISHTMQILFALLVVGLLAPAHCSINEQWTAFKSNFERTYADNAVRTLPAAHHGTAR